MTMRRLSIYFVLSLQLLQLVSLVQAQYSAKRRKDGNPLARSVRVINESGVRVDVFWMNPDTGLLADSNTNQEGIVYGGESGLASYVGHAFEIQELPSSSSKQCQRKLCRKAYFTVNANEDQCTYCTSVAKLEVLQKGL